MPEDRPLACAVDRRGLEQFFRQAVEKSFQQEDHIAVRHRRQDQRPESIQQIQVLDQKELRNAEHHRRKRHRQHQKQQNLICRSHFVTGQRIGAQRIHDQRRKHCKCAVDNRVFRRVSVGDDRIHHHDIVPFQIFLHQIPFMVENGKPLILFRGRGNLIPVRVNRSPCTVECSHIFIFVLEELAPQRLHFPDIRNDAGIPVRRIRHKLPVVILYAHSDIGGSRVSGIERNFKFIPDRGFVINGHFVIIHGLVRFPVFVFDEISVIRNRGTDEPYFLGAHRIDKFSPVFCKRDILLGILLRERNGVHRLISHFIDIIQVRNRAVFLFQPVAVFAGESFDSHVLRRQNQRNELVPVGFDLSAGRLLKRKLHLIECPGIVFMQGVDLFDVLVFLFQELCPEGRGGGIKAQKGIIHILADVFSPEFRKLLVTFRVSPRKRNVLPRIIICTELLIEFGKFARDILPQALHKKSVKVHPIGVQTADLCILELKNLFEDAFAVIR